MLFTDSNWPESFVCTEQTHSALFELGARSRCGRGGTLQDSHHTVTNRSIIMTTAASLIESLKNASTLPLLDHTYHLANVTAQYMNDSVLLDGHADDGSPPSSKLSSSSSSPLPFSSTASHQVYIDMNTLATFAGTNTNQPAGQLDAFTQMSIANASLAMPSSSNRSKYNFSATQSLRICANYDHWIQTKMANS